MMRSFLIALQFLTRLPVTFTRMPQAVETQASILYYPLVGLFIGLLLSGLAWLFASLSPVLAGALVLCTWVLLTGGLHLDGLADSADAWAGGQGDRERTLAIMKDPYIGPVGMVSVLLVILLKFAALVSLLQDAHFAPLLVAPLLGRAVLPLLFLTTPYVRPGGLGAPFAKGIPRNPAIIVATISYLLVAAVFGLAGIGAALAALAAFVLLRTFMCRYVAGTTGDTAGALVELSETTVLICIAVILSFPTT